MCFIVIQVGYAVVGFMSGANWVHEALEKSWDKAYMSDKSLIHDLQIEVCNSEKKLKLEEAIVGAKMRLSLRLQLTWTLISGLFFLLSNSPVVKDFTVEATER